METEKPLVTKATKTFSHWFKQFTAKNLKDCNCKVDG